MSAEEVDEKKRDQESTQLELQVATTKTVESTLGGGDAGSYDDTDEYDSDEDLESHASERRRTLFDGKKLKKFSSWECVTWHVFLLIFLIMISLGRTNQDLNYTQTSAVKARFIDAMTYEQTFGAGEKTFEEIAQFQDWYNYLRVVFEMALKETYESGEDYVSTNDKYYSTMGSRLMGGIRMRQTRFKEIACKNVAQTKFDRCYDFAAEAHGDWRGALNTANEEIKKHRTAGDLDDQLWRGKFNTYPGGGYVNDFPLNYSKAINQLNDLQANDWLDSGTQLVVIDFNLFNPSTHLHTVARIGIEISAGGFFPTYEIKTWLFDRFKSNVAAGYMFCLCATACFIIWFTVLMAREMYNEGLSCYAQDSYWSRTGWRYLDVLNLTIFYATIIAFAVNVSLTKTTDLYDIDNYVSMRRIQYAFLTEVTLLAGNGFLCFFKIFKYFSANERLRFFFTMMQRASSDILLFCLVLVVWFLAFGLFGFLAFSSDLDDFRSVTFAFFNMMRFVVSELPYENLANSSRTFGSAYFVLWSLLMALVLANVFIALLSEAYGEVRSELQKKPDEGFFGLFNGRVEKMSKYVKSLANGRMADVDADGDGQVDVKELMQKTEWPEAKARAFIDKYDVDGNGTLSTQEWNIMQKHGEARRFDEEWYEIKRKQEDEMFERLAKDPLSATQSPMPGTAHSADSVPLKKTGAAAESALGFPAVHPGVSAASGSPMSGIELMRLRDKMFLIEDMLRLVIRENVDNGDDELKQLYRKAESRVKRRTKLLKKASTVFSPTDMDEFGAGKSVLASAAGTVVEEERDDADADAADGGSTE
jgi:hypothetical protein